MARPPVRARLLRQDHLGVAVARNRGAAGSATAGGSPFLDQDDLWHPDPLGAAARLARRTPGRAPRRDHRDRLRHHGRVGRTCRPRPAGGVVGLGPRSPETAHSPRFSRRRTSRARRRRSASISARCRRGRVTVTTSFSADPEQLRLAGGFAPHAVASDDYWLLVNAARTRPLHRVDQHTDLLSRPPESRVTKHGPCAALRSWASALRLGGGRSRLSAGCAAAIPVAS